MNNISLTFPHFDVKWATMVLDIHGFIAFRDFLAEPLRQELLKELRTVTFLGLPTPTDKGVGAYFRTQCSFGTDTFFWALKDGIEYVLQRTFKQQSPSPLRGNLRFNNACIEQFKPGTLEITPAEDKTRYTNLIAVFILEGRSLLTCSIGTEHERNELLSPGAFILLRGKDFENRNDRRFISETRSSNLAQPSLCAKTCANNASPTSPGRAFNCASGSSQIQKACYTVRMRLKILYVAALVGMACGLLATYPVELGPVLSFIIWIVGGIILGLFAAGKKIIITSGIVYGICLSAFFLFSRFGGTPDKLAGYALLVAGFSVAGALGGIAAVTAGALLKRKLFATTP